jgi:dsRNA-specific ribonuclease
VISCYSFSQPNGCRCGIKGIKSAGCCDKSLAQWYAGDEACKFFGGIFGVQNVMEIKDGVGEYGRKMAVVLIVKSLAGAYSQEKGAQATRKFVHDHFLSRTITIKLSLYY